MEIVHVITSLGTGGAERLVVDLAAEGRSRGHRVRIISLGRKFGLPSDWAEEQGLEVVALRDSPRDPRTAIDLRREIGSPDVIHAHLFPTQYFAALLPGPKVFTEHSTSNRRMNRFGWRSLERWSYSRYDAVIAISQGVADALSSHVGWTAEDPRLAVIPNGVRNEFFDSRIGERCENSNLRLVAVGSLRPVKNFSVAIHAVSQLPDTTLDIIGEGPLRDELQHQIDAAGVADRVRILGPIADLASALPTYDALISTSRFEGFALVAAEAMASGLPIIGPDVPGFNNVVTGGDFACLFDPRRGIEGINRAILKARAVRSDSEVRRAARKHAGRFSLTTCFNRYEKLYREVIS